PAAGPRLGRLRAGDPAAARDQDFQGRAPGPKPRRTAHACAGSATPSALCTRVSSSMPSPVVTAIPRDGTISTTVPGAAPFDESSSTEPAHSLRRSGPSPTNAPGNG